MESDSSYEIWAFFIGAVVLALASSGTVILSDPSSERFKAFRDGFLASCITTLVFVVFIFMHRDASIDNIGDYPFFKIIGFIIGVSILRGLAAASPETDITEDYYPPEHEIVTPQERERLAKERANAKTHKK